MTSFSAVPLQLVTYLGFAVSALSLGLVGYALLGRLIGGETPAGWTSVFVAVAFLAGVQRGIYWRGTFYPLAKLREGCVRESDWPAANAIGWH